MSTFESMHTAELPLSAEDVEAAARRLGPVLRRTPLELSHRLSELTGVPVWLKREDLQAVRSYKLRGAHLFMDSLDAADREAGSSRPAPETMPRASPRPAAPSGSGDGSTSPAPLLARSGSGSPRSAGRWSS